MAKYLEKALDQFRTTVHWYVNACDWGDRDLAKKFYEENNELAKNAQEELKVIRQLQIELQWYRSRYPDPPNHIKPAQENKDE